MATLDSLAGDQRAVLQLVLGRGRSYGEIASLLSIDPAAVRERALAALDALGPDAGPPDPGRGLVADYLLGQLPEPDRAAARALLARSPSERAWARTLSAELAPIAAAPLPEIPDASAPPPAVRPRPPEPAAAAAPQAAQAAQAAPRAPEPAAAPRAAAPQPAPAPPPPPRSSRRGGMVLIGAVVVIVAAIIVVVLLRHGPSSHRPSARAAATSTTPATNPGKASPTTATSSTGTGSARIITQINLSPTASGSRAAAIADVLQQGSQREIAIVGQGLPPNTKHNSYAVWLYNAPHDAVRLGFVSPGVTTNGKLSAASPLPADVGRYHKLIVTTETSSKPSTPGPILLEGPITGLG